MFIQLQPKYGVNYKAGQLYFTYDDISALSWGISWFEYKGDKPLPLEKVTHVGLCVDSGWGISAQPQGIDFENLNDIFNDSHRRIIFREPALLECLGESKMTQFAIGKLGTKYNYRLFTGMAIINSWVSRKLLSNKWKQKILKYMTGKNFLLCSQFAKQCLFEGGMTTDKNFLVMPSELFNDPCIKPLKQKM